MTLKINGTALGTATVEVRLSSPILPRRNYRQSYEPRLNRTESRSFAGKDNRRVPLSLFITGPAADVQTEAAFILDLLDSDDPVTFEDTARPLWADQSRVALGIDNVQEDVTDTADCLVYVINLNVSVDGVWTADGGDFCYHGGGSFRGLSEAPTRFIRDDGVETGYKPIVELPEQQAGYPLALSASTRQYEQVPGPDFVVAEWDRDNKLRYREHYDFTGFLILDAPTAEGEGASYDYLSCPTLAYLDRVQMTTTNLQTQAGVDITTQDGTQIVARTGP